MEFSHDSLIIYTTTMLMLIGGLGFVTWHELINKFFRKKDEFRPISWHTKLVLRIYLITAAIHPLSF